MRFTGKIAVITAFANGIGRATAEIMAREGAVVIGVDNHRGRLDEAVAVLRGAGGTAHGRLCDALDAGQADATVASVEREFGRVDNSLASGNGWRSGKTMTLVPSRTRSVTEATQVRVRMGS